MLKKLKNKHFIPIAVVVLAIVMTILYFCKLHFLLYLFGGLLGLISHMLMLVQNRSFMTIAKDKYERVTFHPKKSSVLWYLLRLVLVGGLAALIIYFTGIMYSSDGLQMAILLLSGYITIKVLFIIYILIVKEEGEV